MKKLSFVVSLPTNDNDYQQEQAAAAEKAARRLGVDLKIVNANNDAVAQSQQLLEFVQCASSSRPDAIVFEPAGGTAFPQVARAAAAAQLHRRRHLRLRSEMPRGPARPQALRGPARPHVPERRGLLLALVQPGCVLARRRQVQRSE